MPQNNNINEKLINKAALEMNRDYNRYRDKVSHLIVQHNHNRGSSGKLIKARREAAFFMRLISIEVRCIQACIGGNRGNNSSKSLLYYNDNINNTRIQAHELSGRMLNVPT